MEKNMYVPFASNLTWREISLSYHQKWKKYHYVTGHFWRRKSVTSKIQKKFIKIAVSFLFVDGFTIFQDYHPCLEYQQTQFNNQNIVCLCRSICLSIFSGCHGNQFNETSSMVTFVFIWLLCKTVLSTNS